MSHHLESLRETTMQVGLTT